MADLAKLAADAKQAAVQAPDIEPTEAVIRITDYRSPATGELLSATLTTRILDDEDYGSVDLIATKLSPSPDWARLPATSRVRIVQLAELTVLFARQDGAAWVLEWAQKDAPFREALYAEVIAHRVKCFPEFLDYRSATPSNRRIKIETLPVRQRTARLDPRVG